MKRYFCIHKCTVIVVLWSYMLVIVTAFSKRNLFKSEAFIVIDKFILGECK